MKTEPAFYYCYYYFLSKQSFVALFRLINGLRVKALKSQNEQ
jgi:hypothetical protein